MKTILILMMVLSLFACIALAEPPSLLTHQFFGTVSWDPGEAPPQIVVAKVSSNEFSSTIKDSVCTSSSCSGTYGYDLDNILRVEGSAGDQIQFYLGPSFIQSVSYQADGVSELNLDLAIGVTPDQDDNETGEEDNQTADCDENWNCTEWTNCTEDIKTRICEDLNACDLDNLIRDDTSLCGDNVSDEPVTCEMEWRCSAWRSCQNGEQRRTCTRIDDCDAKLDTGEITSIIETSEAETKPCQPTRTREPVVREPAATPEPKESCFDGIKNQNEDDVDCGGVCSECEEEGLPWFAFGIPLIVIILGAIGGVIYYISTHKAPPLSAAKQQQLRGYFQRHMQKGESKGQIVDNLVKGGWDKGEVKRFSGSVK